MVHDNRRPEKSPTMANDKPDICTGLSLLYTRWKMQTANKCMHVRKQTSTNLYVQPLVDTMMDFNASVDDMS